MTLDNMILSNEAAINDQKNNAVTRVYVDLNTRSYDILIGNNILSTANDEIIKLFPKAKAAVISDNNVQAHHFHQFKKNIALDLVPIILPAGEATKCWSQLQKTVDKILEHRLERNDLIMALGGGVIGDLAGFAAAITRRGMSFIQVPTSLLAMVDSSVGGKTGMNTAQGKNLIGAFHQPSLVICDTAFLETLPERELRAGYAEIMKYGLINDADFFQWLEDQHHHIIKGKSARIEAIANSCRAKAKIVQADEREAGQRGLLNLGHTFGHALEAATGYQADRLNHGEAVAIGIHLAFHFSYSLGFAPMEACERVDQHLHNVGLPHSFKHIAGDLAPTEQLMNWIAQDKKVQKGALNFILAHDIGQSFIAKNVDAEKVRDFLDKRRDQE